MHNTSIKSILGITNLIYLRDIWKMHLLSSEKICFSMKQLASHVSADALQLQFPGMKFFLIHPGNWNTFSEGFKVFCLVLIKDKSSQVIKIFSFSFIFQILQMLLLFQYCTSHILIILWISNNVKSILQKKEIPIYVKLGVTWWYTYTNLIMQ